MRERLIDRAREPWPKTKGGKTNSKFQIPSSARSLVRSFPSSVRPFVSFVRSLRRHPRSRFVPPLSSSLTASPHLTQQPFRHATCAAHAPPRARRGRGRGRGRAESVACCQLASGSGGVRPPESQSTLRPPPAPPHAPDPSSSLSCSPCLRRPKRAVRGERRRCLANRSTSPPAPTRGDANQS